MEDGRQGSAASGADEFVWLRPDVATVWKGQKFKTFRDLDRTKGRRVLGKAAEKGGTVWLETYLDLLNEDQKAWFDGSLDVWKKSVPTPKVDWTEMKAVLEVLKIETPTPLPSKGEDPLSGFLRSLPYVYMRGVFGTIRDAPLDPETTNRLFSGKKGRITAFPTVGFSPHSNGSRGSDAYVMLRTIVAVVGKVVITVRLPDLLCNTRSSHGKKTSCPPTTQVKLIVPKRFIPLWAMPSSRHLAESIGIHQAITARGVSERTREVLAESERHARELTHYERGDEVELPALREKAFDAAERTDDQAEIAKQLDDKISQILRRLGGRDSDIPRTAEALAPPEVERRYRLARDEVRALHDDCRLTSQIVRQALSDYEQKQRERFQFLAALLASIVLIPTLIASIFGASVDVPAEHSDFGFPALLAVIAGLAVTSCYALWTAQRHHWNAGKKQFALPVIVAIAIVVAYAVFLVQS